MDAMDKTKEALRKETMAKLAAMPPAKRKRLLDLEAKRRGIEPKRTESPNSHRTSVTLSASEMLTPSELERLRQSAIDLTAYGRKAFQPKN